MPDWLDMLTDAYAASQPRNKRTDWVGFLVAVGITSALFAPYLLWLFATRPSVRHGDMLMIIVVDLTLAICLNGVLAVIYVARRRRRDASRL